MDTATKLDEVMAGLDRRIADAVAKAIPKAAPTQQARGKNSVEVRGGGTEYPETRIRGWPLFSRAEEFLPYLQKLLTHSPTKYCLAPARNPRPTFMVLQFETLEDRKAFNDWQRSTNIPPVRISTGVINFKFQSVLEPVFKAKTAELRHSVWWLNLNVQGDATSVTNDYSSMALLLGDVPILAFGSEGEKEMHFWGEPTVPRCMIFDSHAAKQGFADRGIDFLPDAYFDHMLARFPDTKFVKK